MKIILVILALAAACQAFPAKLKWNRNPEPDISEYRIYQVIDGVPVLKQTVIPAAEGDKITSQPIDMESGQVYTVTAYNGFESEHSDPVTVPVKPSKPGAVEVVEIEVSANNTDWEPVALVPLKTEAHARFIRTRITTVTPSP